MSKKEENTAKIAMEYIEVTRELKALEEKKAALSSALFALIPRGEDAHGLKHSFEETKSVSWKKVSEAVIKDLVPSTKRGIAEEIIANSTTISSREYIRRLVE
jgi:hypothetical protein